MLLEDDLSPEALRERREKLSIGAQPISGQKVEITMTTLDRVPQDSD